MEFCGFAVFEAMLMYALVIYKIIAGCAEDERCLTDRENSFNFNLR